MADVTAGNLVVKVKTDNADFKKKMKESNESTKSFSQSIKNMKAPLIAAGVALAALGATAVVVGKKFAKMAAEQEDIFRALRTMVELQGDAWEDAKPKIDAFAASLQKTTRYGDTDTARVLQKILIFTDDLGVAMIGTKIAMDMAAAKLFDVGTASRMVGMAMAGNIEMLGRYISEFKASNNEMLRTMTLTEKAAWAMEFLQEKFGGAAEKEMATFSAQIARINNFLGDFEEAVGDVIIKALMPLVEKVYELIIANEKLILMKIADWGDKAVKAFGKVKRAIDIALVPLELWLTALGAVGILIDKISGKEDKIFKFGGGKARGGRGAVGGFPEDLPTAQPPEAAKTGITGQIGMFAGLRIQNLKFRMELDQSMQTLDKNMQETEEALRRLGGVNVSPPSAMEQLAESTVRIFKRLGADMRWELERVSYWFTRDVLSGGWAFGVSELRRLLKDAFYELTANMVVRLERELIDKLVAAILSESVKAAAKEFWEWFVGTTTATWFVEKMKWAVKGLKEAGNWLWKGIRDIIESNWFVGKIKDIGKGLLTGGEYLWEGLEKVWGWAETAADSLMKAFKWGGYWLDMGLKNIWGTIETAILSLTKAFKWGGHWLWEGMKTVWGWAETAAWAVVKIFLFSGKHLWGGMKTVWGWIETSVLAIVKLFELGGSWLWDGLKTVLTSTYLVGAIDSIVKLFKFGGSWLWAGLKTVLTSTYLIQAIKWVVSLFKGVKNTVSDAIVDGLYSWAVAQAVQHYINLFKPGYLSQFLTFLGLDGGGAGTGDGGGGVQFPRPKAAPELTLAGRSLFGEEFYANFPAFQGGGIVQGMLNQRRIITAHAGEEVLPRSSPRHIKNAGGSSVIINVTGNTILDDRTANKLANTIMDKLSNTMRLKQRYNIIGGSS